MLVFAISKQEESMLLFEAPSYISFPIVSILCINLFRRMERYLTISQKTNRANSWNELKDQFSK